MPETVGIGSADVEHAIEVENGSTLAHDFEIGTKLPNSVPHHHPGLRELEFDNNGKKGTSWTAEISGLGPNLHVIRAANIRCLAAARCDVVVDSSKIEYREDPSFSWQEDPQKILIISIEVL